MTASLRAQEWWTEADQAELTCMAHELIQTVFKHKPDCSVCIAGYPPCPAVRAAIEVVLDWRQARVLFSKAVWLRRIQDASDGLLQEAA